MVKGYIYCLKNPLNNDAVFYVGQTVLKLKDRLQSHIRESRFRVNSKGTIIQSILEAKQMPIIEVLEEFNKETYSDFQSLMNTREAYWITQFSNLCNKSHAGYELICDNCLTPFTAKRLRAKFCSDICRASFHQKNPKKEPSKKSIKELSTKEMYDYMLEMLQQINKILSGESQKSNRFILDEVGTWQTPKTFQQFMNQIADLQYEAEYKALYDEIEASDLTQKQKQLLFINMSQSKM